MIEWFLALTPVMQALLGTCFTWLLTALGAGVVFFFKSINRKVMDAMLGGAAGVMIAASFWSLLAPAIEMAEEAGNIPWVPALIGFLSGGGFLWLIDKILPHLHPGFPTKEAEGIKTSWQRSVLLVLAITLHNIPEGLAVGVAFGAAAAGHPAASIGAAIALAIGIGIQNFPEGQQSLYHSDVKDSHATKVSCMVNSQVWSSQLPVCWEPLLLSICSHFFPMHCHLRLVR